MRSEQAILELVLSTAQNDDRIRAVILSGSRTDPNAPRDIFQDFDILYLVTELDPFIENHTWIGRFGELMMLQMPEAMQDAPPQKNGGFAYLMQFTDGNRIDLSLFPIAMLDQLEIDSLSVVLLDKDKLFQPFPPPSDSDYLPAPPTAQAFADCCNEFWWVCPGVAKGLWREEITYAKHIFDRFVREQHRFIMSTSGCEPLVLALFHARGCRPQIGYEVRDVSTILAMVRAGLGVSVLPALTLPDALDGVHVVQLEPQMPAA